MDAARDYYRVLEVTAGADAAAIQAAYRALAKKFHPDAPAETRSAERFIEVQEAYEVLGSRDAKDAYDAACAERQRQDRQRADAEAAWQSLLRDEPDIAGHQADLSRLANSLGRRYRAGILAGMDGRSPGDFADYLEEQFLARHFGQDPQIKRLGKALLRDGQRTAAAELAGEVRKLPAGRLTAQQRKDLVARFKLKRPSIDVSKAWPRFAPFVGLVVVLGLIAIGLVDYIRSSPKDVPTPQTALPKFGGPQIGLDLKPVFPQATVASERKSIDDRLPDGEYQMPETTATTTRDVPLQPAPAKRIYDRIEAND